MTTLTKRQRRELEMIAAGKVYWQPPAEGEKHGECVYATPDGDEILPTWGGLKLRDLIEIESLEDVEPGERQHVRLTIRGINWLNGDES